MSVKVVVAVGNRKIERCIARMEAIDVLTTVRKREAVLDAVINYNPHAVILSRELSGKTEMTDVIQRCRNLKEQCRIVFIYGEVDAEYKYFLIFWCGRGSTTSLPVRLMRIGWRMQSNAHTSRRMLWGIKRDRKRTGSPYRSLFRRCGR